jgi:hypothetical protein
MNWRASPASCGLIFKNSDAIQFSFVIKLEGRNTRADTCSIALCSDQVWQSSRLAEFRHERLLRDPAMASFRSAEQGSAFQSCNRRYSGVTPSQKTELVNIT